MDSATVIHIHL